MGSFTQHVPYPEGISILIPVFNYSVVQLAETLHAQAAKLSVPFEILCYDDCSAESWKLLNRSLLEMSGICYRELPTNLGRSRIRNLLAKEARYCYLLFLDCDSAIDQDDFLSRYWSQRNNPVVVGGRKYSDQPTHRDYLLHWMVGKTREEMPAAFRNERSHDSFMFNNVFIRKNIYSDIWLDESIVTYGHEDTKFGYELKSKHIPVLHTNNPAIHAGLDDTESFLKKTREGISNLCRLTREGYARNSKLYSYFRIVRLLHLDSFVLFLYKVFLKKKVADNLRSSHPKLFFFDLFKLSSFIEDYKQS